MDRRDATEMGRQAILGYMGCEVVELNVKRQINAMGDSDVM